MGTTQPDHTNDVTIITRTLVRGQKDAFEQLQRELNRAAAHAPGFIEQTIIPPGASEPAHWVTLQWFDRSQNAMAWLNSRERLDLLQADDAPIPGPDEVHIVWGGSVEAPTSGACAIITTRVKPGAENKYRAWQDRMGAALSLAPGFRGYRFEPPISSVQDAWIVVMRFASEPDLSAWLNSPARLTLVKEAEPLTESMRTRVAGAGLDQWFRIPDGVLIPPTWKMSMLVLLGVYPTIFLVLQLVSWPLLIKHGVPAWLSTFMGNVICVTTLSVVIPWLARRFGWWLRPQGGRTRRNDLVGALTVVGFYVLLLSIFAGYSAWAG